MTKNEKPIIKSETGIIPGFPDEMTIVNQLINNNPSVILIVDFDTKVILTYNKAALDFYGYSDSELKNINLKQLFVNSHESGLNLLNENPFLEAIHATKNGELKHVQINSSVVVLENKKSHFIIINDITENDKKTKELIAKSELYEIIFHSTLSGIMIIDKETHKIIEINRAALDMIGADKDYVIGRVCHNFVCPAQENCCPVTDLNQKINYDEKVLYKKDGSKLDIIKTVNEKKIGNKTYLIENIIDITDRTSIEKELFDSESKFRNIFESIDDLYYQTDLEGTLTLLSPSVYELTGWKEEELIGKKSTYVYKNPSDRDTLLAALKMQGYIKDYELLLKKKDNSDIPVSLTGSLIFDEKGNPVGVRGLLRDITKRKHAEEIQAYFQKFRSILLQISERFVSFSVDKLDTLFDTVLMEIGKFLNIDRSYIFIIDWQQSTLSNTNEWCAEGISVQKDSLQDIPLAALPEWMAELEAFKTIHIPSVANLPKSWSNVKEVLESQQIQSLVVVPLAKNNNLLGFIGFDSVLMERYWHEEEIGLLGILAHNISNALDRSKAEEALRKSEERYRYLAENMADVVWIIDINTRQYQYISPSVERLRGFTAEEAMEQSIEESMSAESYKIMKEKIELRIQNYINGDMSLVTSTDEIIQPCKNGAFIISEVVSTIYGNNTHNLKLVGVTRDITKRKQTEKALIENERRLKMFFSMSLVGFYFMMLDKPVKWNDNNDKDSLLDYIFTNMKMTEFNDALLEQYSASREEFLGTNLNDLFIHNIEYGKEVVKKLLDDGILDMITDERRADGSQVWIEGSYKCLYDDLGRLIGHFGVQRDITARINAEKEIVKLTKGIEQSPVSIVITNKNGLIEYVNPKFSELTGYSFEEAIGKNPNILKADYYNDEFYKGLWVTISSGDEWRGEFCNKKKNGEIFWENSSISPIKDNNGEITHYIAVKEDITERKKTDEELRELIMQLRESHRIIEESLFEKNSLIIELSETQEKLEKSNSEKDKFFSIIAHDLRNPFAALISNSDLLESYYHRMDDEKRIKLIRGMKEASKFTYSLLENLLQWSRAQMGTFLVKPDRVMLYTLMVKLTMVLKAQADNKQINLVINCEDDVAPFCDPDMIDTVIRNLVSNAIKFSNTNTEITIEASEYEINPNYYVININDSGVGIAQENIGKLFNIAANISTRGTNNENGSGLGLLLCKEFVEMNGGKIWVTSEKGIGSTFSFTVPKSSRI